MTEWITTNYAIASGHDNFAGLTAFTDLSDGFSYFVEPLGLPNFSRGTRRFTLAQPRFAGSQTTALVFSRLTVGQMKYLIDNYEGLVTVRLALGSTDFRVYNGTLLIPSFSDVADSWYIDANENTGAFLNVRCDLIDLIETGGAYSSAFSSAFDIVD